MKHLFTLLSAVLLSAHLSAGMIDVNGTLCPSDTLEQYQVGPGTTYTRFNVSINNKQHRMYMLTIDLTNPHIKIEEYQAKDSMGATEDMRVAHQKIDSAGHRPIGAVNCNFWCVSGNISSPSSAYAGLLGQPFSGTAKDGVLIGNPSDWNAQGDRGFFMIDELGRALIRNMKWNGRVSKGADKGRAIRDCNRRRNNPNANEIALFNRYAGTTRAVADTVIEVVFEPIDGQEWAINDTMQCVVLSRNNTGLTKLTGKMGALQGRGERGNWVNNNLQVGDTFQIKLGMYSQSETPDDNFSGDSIAPRVMQMVTGNCLVMAEGQLTSRNYNEGYNNQNYPRTLLATNNEGNRLWLLVSQDPGNYTHEMCAIVRNDGATWAAGMDGGGSAQMEVLNEYKFISRDGSPRPVANSLFVVSTAPDDSLISSMAFYEPAPTIASYASYTPALRAYNQYGVLLSNDFRDYTLSVSPASLGTISADGKTFIAGATAGTGTLTATFGAVQVSQPITIEEGEVRLAFDSVLIDTREYTIQAYSGDDSNPLLVDPAYFSWTTNDARICAISEAGALRGLSNGETTIQGTLGNNNVNMYVTVEIPDAPTLMQTRFLGEDTTIWTLKNGSNPINWGMTADSIATLNFAVSSARNPQISLTGDLRLYSLPDSIELIVESPTKLKSVGLIAQAHNSTNTVSASITDELPANTLGYYKAAISDFKLDTTDIGIWPVCLTKIVLTLTDVTVKQPYELKLHGIRLHYHNYMIESKTDELNTIKNAEKILQDGRIIIRIGNSLYDILGRKIE